MSESPLMRAFLWGQHGNFKNSLGFFIDSFYWELDRDLRCALRHILSLYYQGRFEDFQPFRIQEFDWIFSLGITSKHKHHYANNPVEKVSSSVFVIWNSGNKVIDGERLKTIDPLRIEACDDTRILRYNIQKVNNKTNNIKIVPHPFFSNTLFISFDFLNKKDGLRVEVLHTGSRESLCVTGTLKGIKPLNTRNKFILNKASEFIFKNINIFKTARKHIIFGCLFGLFCIFIYSFINPDFFAQSRPRTGSFNIWTFRAILFVYFMLPTYLFYKIRPPYPSKLRAENNDVDS